MGETEERRAGEVGVPPNANVLAAAQQGEMCTVRYT